jgi:hypothetical protein
MKTKRTGYAAWFLALSAALLLAFAALPGCYPKSQVYSVGNVGGLIFHVNPADADVLLDGVVQGKASDFTQERYLKVSAGVHRVELRSEGYETYSREVNIGTSLERIEAALIRKK